MASQFDSNSIDSVDPSSKSKSVDTISSENLCFVTGEMKGKMDNSTQESSNERFVTPDCPDVYVPFIGQCFVNLEDAKSFYYQYARICGFSIRIGTKCFHKDGTLMIQRFSCHRKGYNKNLKTVDTLDVSETDCRIRKVTRCGCEARFCVKFKAGGNYYVYDFVKNHNHTLASDIGRQFLSISRGLSETQQNLMVDCGRLGMGATKAHRLMAEMAGGYSNVGATVTDFKNFKRDLKTYIGGCDAQMVVDHLLRRKSSTMDYSFEYFSDPDGTLLRLFWADNTAKRDAAIFGDVISFDATYSSNKYKMVFVPFTGVDNHKRSITLGAGLISHEDADSYIWLLECFRKFLDHDPIMLVTDQDLAMKKAISVVFPNVHHRYCMWHITEKLKTKVGVNICKNTDFIKNISSVIWGDHVCPEDFEDSWNEVISRFDLGDNHWLRDMYNIRSNWIPVFFRDIRMGSLIRTTSRSESENSFFSKFIHSNMTLVEFILAFDTAMDAQRHPRMKLDHDCRTTTMKIKTPLEIEKNALEIYTHSIFLDIQSEIFECGYLCAVDGINREDDSVVYNIKDKCYRKHNFKVIFNQSSCFANCNCMKFESTGIICRHIFLVFSANEVTKIPKQYVLTRWHKYATAWTADNFSKNNRDSAASVMCDAWFEFRSLVDLASHDKCKFQEVVDKVKAMKNEFMMNNEKTFAGTKSGFFRSVLGMEQPEEVLVKIPNVSKNKGRSKRLKSKREEAIIKSKRTKRVCSNCGIKGFHDTRNCPSKIAVGSIEVEGEHNKSGQNAD